MGLPHLRYYKARALRARLTSADSSKYVATQIVAVVTPDLFPPTSDSIHRTIGSRIEAFTGQP